MAVPSVQYNKSSVHSWYSLDTILIQKIVILYVQQRLLPCSSQENSGISAYRPDWNSNSNWWERIYSLLKSLHDQPLRSIDSGTGAIYHKKSPEGSIAKQEPSGDLFILHEDSRHGCQLSSCGIIGINGLSSQVRKCSSHRLGWVFIPVPL